MYIKSYKDLIVWQKSMDLAVVIYEITSKYPKSEIYGLSSQSQRAGVSIPSNIAEGYGKRSRKQYCEALLIAYSSSLELETQLILAKRLNYTIDKDYEKAMGLLIEVQKMLNSMTSAFKKQF